MLSRFQVQDFCNFRESPIILFILVVTILIWFSDVNFKSSMMLMCFLYVDWVAFPLLNTKFWGTLRQNKVVFCFKTKDNNLTLLVGSGLKSFFHWKIQSHIISKSLLRSLVEVWLTWIRKNKDLSSENNLALVESPPEGSFLQNKNDNEPRKESWDTATLAVTLKIEKYALSYII